MSRNLLKFYNNQRRAAYNKIENDEGREISNGLHYALAFDDEGGVTNTPLEDKSSNNHTITYDNGGARACSHHPYYRHWCIDFRIGSVQAYYLTMPYSQSYFDWWTTDYTLEYWVYVDSWTGISYNDGVDHPTAFGHRTPTSTTDYWSFGPLADGSVRFYYFNGAAVTTMTTSTGLVKLNQWHHLAMTKTGGVVKIFVDGEEEFTGSVEGTPQSDNTGTLSLGAGNSTYFRGCISNLRIVKGTSIYPGSFIVPRDNLEVVANTQLLIAHANRFMDSSPNNITLTVTNYPRINDFNPFKLQEFVPNQNRGSLDFQGRVNESINTPIASMHLEDGDFTVECWIYKRDTPATDVIADTRATVGNGPAGWLLYSVSSGVIGFFVQVGLTGYPAWGASALVSAPINTHEWVHVAVVRHNGVITFYTNGVAGNTKAYSGRIQAQRAGHLGISVSTSPNPGTWGGHITEFRIEQTAKYTSNFTPPTEPIETGNAQLHLQFDNSKMWLNGPNKWRRTFRATTANAISSKVQTKFNEYTFRTTSSGYGVFGISSFDFFQTTTDWTLEAWIYLTGAGDRFFAFNSESTGSNTVLFSRTNAYITDTGYNYSEAFDLDQWQHFAATYEASPDTLKVYKNGKLVITRTAAFNIFDDVLGIGVEFDNADAGTPGNYQNGYYENIQFFDFIKYTEEFRPPYKTQGPNYQNHTLSLR